MAFQLTVAVTGGNTRTLTISDSSNYTAGEGNHSHNRFSYMYAIQIYQLAENTQLDLLSDFANLSPTVGVLRPSEYVFPTPVVNTYVVTVDGLYRIRTIAVPTWTGDAPYTYDADNVDYVLNTGASGGIYKLLQTSDADNPESSPTYWELVVDDEDFDTIYAALSSKYVSEIYQYSDVSLRVLWNEMIYRVHTEQNLIGDDVNSLMRNREWKDMAALFLDHQAISGHLSNANYEAISDIFTRATILLTKYA